MKKQISFSKRFASILMLIMTSMFIYSCLKDTSTEEAQFTNAELEQMDMKEISSSNISPTKAYSDAEIKRIFKDAVNNATRASCTPWHTNTPECTTVTASIVVPAGILGGIFDGCAAQVTYTAVICPFGVEIGDVSVLPINCPSYNSFMDKAWKNNKNVYYNWIRLRNQNARYFLTTYFVDQANSVAAGGYFSVTHRARGCISYNLTTRVMSVCPNSPCCENTFYYEWINGAWVPMTSAPVPGANNISCSGTPAGGSPCQNNCGELPTYYYDFPY